MSVRVVKIGGAALSDAAWLESFAVHLRRAGGRVVVVHGGGPDITALSERLGLTVAWSEGRRVTDGAALDIASMVLTGRLNKRIVRSLVNAHVDALGISGEDGGLVVSVPAESGRLGRVGEVVHVRTELLHWLLERGLVPVLSPISRGNDGEALNVNADEVAAAVAAALGATELLFLTDVPGVLAAGQVVPSLEEEEAKELLVRQTARGGMAVKLRSALAALASGVERVRIGSLETLVDEAVGTRVTRPQERVA